jgi:prophage tail gpP-like protein
LTEDLVDCSAVPNEWVKTKLSQIASAIVKPHNVQLKVLGDPTIEKFTIKKDDSETVIDAIHQLANNEGMIVYDSPKGELVIGPVGSKSGNYLKNKKDDEQSNVLSGEHKDDMSNRFYEIQVRSQTKGTDESFGTKNQQIQAIANDKTIRPNRVLIIDAPRPLNQIEAQKLANWQNAANCGKSIEFTYDVFGWKGPVELWAINTLINVEDDFYVVKVPMLISKVVFKISESGTTTSLTLNPPSAYIPNPIQDKEPVGKVKKGRKKGKKSKEPVVFWKEEDGV